MITTKFTIVRRMPDDLVEVIDHQGRRRRVRMIVCAECEDETPDYLFHWNVPVSPAGSAPICPDCKRDIGIRDANRARISILMERREASKSASDRREKVLALASPAWRDRQKIKAIYAEARRLTKDTGVQHHVDHHYPLQGKLCCGLHVHQNLRILTAAANQRKRAGHPLDESPALLLAG